MKFFIKSNSYFDYASLTPIDRSVCLLMNKILKNNIGNPSSIHKEGIISKNIISDSRSKIAKILNVHSDEIIFTNSGTMSNNIAILGVLSIYEEKKNNINHKLPHMIMSNIEHASVRETMHYLRDSGRINLSEIGVDSDGIISAKDIVAKMTPETILVSIIYANNEIGTIQPIREIAREIRHYKKSLGRDPHLSGIYPIFHTDSAQAMQYLEAEPPTLGVDLLSFNGSKIYGPRGMGILYIKRKTPIKNIIFGGDQEMGFFPGTENTIGVAGLALALEKVNKIKKEEKERMEILKNYFVYKINEIPNIIHNGSIENRIPNIINISVPDFSSELLVIYLSARGIYVSAKSACKSADMESSHVIEAINKSRPPLPNGISLSPIRGLAGGDRLTNSEEGSLRFSMGRQTTKKDIDRAVKNLISVIKLLSNLIAK